MFNSQRIRGQSCPKGYGGPKKGLEGSGEKSDIVVKKTVSPMVVVEEKGG